MKTFVINLPQFPTKREFIIDQLKRSNINDFEFINAVDGNKLTEEYIDSITDKEYSVRYIRRPLAKTELGCALSHMNIYNSVITNGLSAAIILEDDAVLPANLDLNDIAAQCCDYDIVLLGASTHDETLRDGSVTGCVEKTEDRNVFGTFAYYVTLSGAEKMKDQFSIIKYPIDSWTMMTRLGVKVGILAPLPISVNLGLESYIAKERSDLRKQYMSK